MSHPLLEVSRRFDEALSAAFGADASGVDPLVRATNNPKFGDYQANVAMSLAKRLKRNPREVAGELVERFEADGLCETPEIAGPGFINIRLLDSFLADATREQLLDERVGVPAADPRETVVIDYSSTNVAKDMHVGHIRSTVIGDSLARTLAFLGHLVIRQNHIGDWGTQFGMLLEYLVDSGWTPDSGGEHTIEDLNELYRAAKKRFDAEPEFAERSRSRVVALQGGDEASLALWRRLVEESLRHVIATYEHLGILLDADDTCGESFYNPRLEGVLQDLEAKGLAVVSDGAVCVFPDGFKGRDDEPLPLIIRKKDGGFLYATTDLAAVRYRFGDLGADRAIYVVDARQRQHFAMVFEVAKMAGWIGDGRAEHVMFGTILGEDGKPFKTRSGDTVRLWDLLDEAVERAAKVIEEKNPTLSGDEKREIAEIVGLGAVKYADLSSDRVKDYVFSWERMLAFEGNTSPYLQNAYVRIQSIFRKGGVSPDDIDASALAIVEPAERALAVALAQFAPTVEAVGETLEPHRLCNYLFELASTYHQFYERCPVLKADDDKARASRLLLCHATARVLAKGLSLLGIRTLDRM